MYCNVRLAVTSLLMISSFFRLSMGQINQFKTNPILNRNSLQFDCLHYYVSREGLKAYQEFANVVEQMTPYCIRPVTLSNGPWETPTTIFGRKVSFEELYVANVTAQQLLAWSNPIDVAERYQLYFNNPTTSSNDFFYNCTEPWFGLWCQYSSDLGVEFMSVSSIIESEFRGRKPYPTSSNMIIELPCYTLLKCNRGGSLLCLDWREICDGMVDCLDDAVDETSCFDLEVNECAEGEYRCHNGLCIPHEFWDQDLSDADCLDRSDESIVVEYLRLCYRDPTFRCEEHSCHPLGLRFACGDGLCVARAKKCQNGRHSLLINSLSTRGDLPDKCWTAMVCLTGLVPNINGSLCHPQKPIAFIFDYLEHCEANYQFPTIPVLHGHVRFLYHDAHKRSDVSNFFLPDYICYDSELCDEFSNTFNIKNLTCISAQGKLHGLDSIGISWFGVFLRLKDVVEGCMATKISATKQMAYANHSSLYQCPNSLKLISKHRLLDGVADCAMGVDESWPDTCRLNDSYRWKCGDSDICVSPILERHECVGDTQKNSRKVPFNELCDRLGRYSYRSNGQNFTDEENCEHWPCDNIYTRCDGYWNCPKGEDEYGCGHFACENGTQACVSALNYTLVCLPAAKVNDLTDDCLGATDEPFMCRMTYWKTKTYPHFRCTNIPYCLTSSELCDAVDNCPNGEDEKFCGDHQFICDPSGAGNRSEAEDFLCKLDENEFSTPRFFSMKTTSNYPTVEGNMTAALINWSAEGRLTVSQSASPSKDNAWPWYCNRGVPVRSSMENHTSHRTCLCPPSYYGHLCQYQNQRVSLTLRLSSIHRNSIFSIVSMLIDDNDEQRQIDAYDQSIYIVKESCTSKLNRYLLFPTRPKNLTKNYSIHVDAMEKNTMAYVGSWHLSIPFLFLPVNRINALLILSDQPVKMSSQCSDTCKYGQCTKYVNKEKYFCRCSSGWSGSRCDVPTNCANCSSLSICLGTSNNQSICVCPVNRFGPRCVITSLCPFDACQNGAHCIPGDVTIAERDYTCICSEEYFGDRCQYRRIKLDVSLQDMTIPPYLSAYFFTLSNESDPVSTLVVQKLTLFQRTATFRVAILFHVVIIEANEKYYLALIQTTPRMDISTSISPAQRCMPVGEFFDSTVMKMIVFERMKRYPILCKTLLNLKCFVDDAYLCFCTDERHPNCMDFNQQRDLRCSSNDACLNGARCVQDHPYCPSKRICVCADCFFGDKCEFYAKGLGATLDEILGYEIKSNTALSQQPFSVKLSAIVTMLMLLIGVINAIISILIFRRKKPLEVGCGLYLLTSSVTSLSVMILFTSKFWLLFLSRQTSLLSPFSITWINCRVIEPLLKIVIYTDNWLNACVAIERVVSTLQGITFNKRKSKWVAERMIPFMCVINAVLLVPQQIYLYIYNDTREGRAWCVTSYSRWLQIYSTTIIFFQYLGPLVINLCSPLFIIFATARKRSAAEQNIAFSVHLMTKLKRYQPMIRSSLIIIALTLPHLIISFTLDCNKSSSLFWFYLSGYFLSIVPAVFIGVIFIVPAPLYRQEFEDLIKRIRRRCA